MLDDEGKPVKEAGPSTPIELLGLNGTPAAGDEFSVASDEKTARELAEFRREKSQEQRVAMQQAAKMENMFAHRSFLDAGIPVAPASDYTPGPYEPMMAIQSMVTRKDFEGRVWGPNQRISIDQALKVCTMNGAYASFEENIKGSITVGKLADFVILADAPHDVNPDQIKNIEVVRTVVGGTTMHAS